MLWVNRMKYKNFCFESFTTQRGFHVTSCIKKQHIRPSESSSINFLCYYYKHFEIPLSWVTDLDRSKLHFLARWFYHHTGFDIKNLIKRTKPTPRAITKYNDRGEIYVLVLFTNFFQFVIYLSRKFIIKIS